MKFNKEFIIIIVLASLLMSAIGSAYYFYDKQNKILEDSNKKVKVYIAKNDIEKNALIKEADLTTHIMTKQEILKNPLTIKEIVGKFATTRIYKNELLLKKRFRKNLLNLKKKSF